MSGPRLFQSKGRSARPRINRTASPLIARTVPWLTIALGSIVPAWFLIASAPVLPPFGFLMLLSWRQLRPGLLPIWAGLPLGLIDDIYSGQPMGCAIMLWSLAGIVLDYIEARLPWRNFAMEWLVAAGLISTYIVIGLAFANIAGASTPLFVIVPQIIISILIYPLVGRLVSGFDRLRLTPFSVVN